MINLSTYLEDRSKKLRLIAMLLNESKIKISNKYKFHFNYIMMFYIISFFITIPNYEIIGKETIIKSDIGILLFNILFALIYYSACVNIYLRLKTLQDDAKEKTYDKMPSNIKKESLIRFIIKNKNIYFIFLGIILVY